MLPRVRRYQVRTLLEHPQECFAILTARPHIADQTQDAAVFLFEEIAKSYFDLQLSEMGGDERFLGIAQFVVCADGKGRRFERCGNRNRDNACWEKRS